jgi:putative FmdB family regulatory protein
LLQSYVVGKLLQSYSAGKFFFTDTPPGYSIPIELFPGVIAILLSMPTYEYKCSKCQEVLEVVHAMTDKPPVRHSGCGGKLSRVFSAPTVTYSGSGWARKKT